MGQGQPADKHSSWKAGPGAGAQDQGQDAATVPVCSGSTDASPSGQMLSTRNAPLPVLKARVPAGGAPGASLPGCGRGVASV